MKSRRPERVVTQFELQSGVLHVYPATAPYTVAARIQTESPPPERTESGMVGKGVRGLYGSGLSLNGIILRCG